MAAKKQSDEIVDETKEAMLEEGQVEEVSVETDTENEPEVEEVEAEDVEMPEASTEDAAPKASKKEVKTFDPDELVAKKSSRFAHALSKASKKDKAEMFRSEHIVTEYGDEEVENDATRLRNEQMELLASSQSQKILEGTIVGYKYAGEQRKSTILVEIGYGDGLFTIYIPVYLLFDYDMENQEKYVSEEMNKQLEAIVSKRIGATVKFVVKNVDQKTRTAFADRLKAMDIMGQVNYKRPLDDGKPRIVEGMLVKANVQQVMSQYILVDALGAEIKIPRAELSHFHVGNAREEFHVGDHVVVRVSNITSLTTRKNNDKYTLITADGSIKDATKDPKPRLFEKYKVDGRYAAEVTYVEEIGVFCRLHDGMDVLVSMPRFGEIPHRGQKRVVEIKIKDEEKMRLLGIFVNN